jgi:hypothetical protein
VDWLLLGDINRAVLETMLRNVNLTLAGWVTRKFKRFPGRKVAAARFVEKLVRTHPATDRLAVVELVGATTTNTGLTVKCAIDPRTYQKGVKLSDAQLDAISLATRSTPNGTIPSVRAQSQECSSYSPMSPYNATGGASISHCVRASSRITASI